MTIAEDSYFYIPSSFNFLNDELIDFSQDELSKSEYDERDNYNLKTLLKALKENKTLKYYKVYRYEIYDENDKRRVLLYR